MKKIVMILTVIIGYFPINACVQDKKQDQVKVEIKTDYGRIILVLYNETKLHKENFLKLVKDGYYTDLYFHRLIKDYIVQGGDSRTRKNQTEAPQLQAVKDYKIPAEITSHYFHKKGVLAAARNGNDINPLKASSGTQFYIVQGEVFTRKQLDNMVELNEHAPFTESEILVYTTLGGAPNLDSEYTIFGEVIKGFDVLDTIMKISVDENNKPLQDIRFTIKISE